MNKKLEERFKDIENEINNLKIIRDIQTESLDTTSKVLAIHRESMDILFERIVELENREKVEKVEKQERTKIEKEKLEDKGLVKTTIYLKKTNFETLKYHLFDTNESMSNLIDEVVEDWLRGHYQYD